MSAVYQDKKPVSKLIGSRLQWLLGVVFLLFALLSVNSVYLGVVTIIEAITGNVYQDYFYLLMFLLHLVLGLLLVVPLVVFGLLHQHKARHRKNRYAVYAGMALYTFSLVLLVSGIVLTRFGFFEVNDPTVRQIAYWAHVITPFAVIWLFVLHRLAGPPIQWQRARYWGAVVVLFTGLAVVLQVQLKSSPEADTGTAGMLEFKPSNIKVASGKLIEAHKLTTDAECTECHADIGEQTKISMHKLSSFNNPAYRPTVEDLRKKLMKRDGNVNGSRHCAACHDLAPLMSGAFDDPNYNPHADDPVASAGITCVSCHAVKKVNSPMGNTDFVYEEPSEYPFGGSSNPILKSVNHQLIKAKPEFHKETLLKPHHKTAEFCSGCHKVNLPFELNNYRWLRGQNHYDSFLLSGVSGHRVDSFYYPKEAKTNCAQCHMPLKPSDDPAARDFDKSGKRSVHDHGFLAANTGVPYMLGLKEDGFKQREAMLQKAARVDIFGLKEGGDINGKLHAPLRPELPVLQPGQQYLLETVVRTVGVGHHLTQGTADSNELWLDVVVKNGDKVIGRSGGKNQAREVDPWSYFLDAYPLDKDGERMVKRNADTMVVALYNHQIPPGAADVVHYRLNIPQDVQGEVTVEVKLQYRKFNSAFYRYLKGKDYAENDLPIVTMAVDSITLPVGEASPKLAEQKQGIETWQRWNDYGIGLLREGDRLGSVKGELRQAEAVFRTVMEAGRVDGAVNLARVFFKEGRLDEAADILKQATGKFDPPAPPWTVAWFSARIDQEFGNLDQAIATLEDLVNTRYEDARQRGFDFSYDINALNELGRILAERARQERGDAKQQTRQAFLERAKGWFDRVLEIDPEDLSAHYNLAMLYRELGEQEKSAHHSKLHDKYRPDDQAIERTVALHRGRNPAADHAAAAIAVYDLHKPENYELPAGAVVAHQADTPPQENRQDKQSSLIVNGKKDGAL